MSKLDYQRLDDIMDGLLIRSNHWPLSDITNEIRVSDRTIRSDIKLLNQILAKENAQIELIRGKGYLLNTPNKIELVRWWTEFEEQDVSNSLESSENRQNYLFFLLFKEDTRYTADHLMDLLYISKNTFYNYMKNIRNQILEYQLKIINHPNIGFEIVGSEFNKRQAIIELLIKKDLQEYILGFTETEMAFFDNIDLMQIQKIEMDCLSDLALLESDFYHKNILSSLVLSLSRIKRKQKLDNLPVVIPELSKETSLQLDNFFSNLENELNLIIPSVERNYFIYHLSFNAPRLIENQPKAYTVEEKAQKIVIKLLALIKEETNYNWLNDEILIKDLKTHVIGFINMSLMDAGRQNPLLEMIKSTFPLAYLLSTTHIETIEKEFNLYFSEDEIGYIALHIAGALERNNKKEQHLKLAIVCGSGVAMSRIVESKIKRFYPSSVSIVARVSYAEFKQMDLSNIDLIVTTVPIIETTIPTIFINMNNLDKEVEKLNKYFSSSQNQESNVENLFDKKFFLVDKTIVDKKNLLKKMIHPLIENNIVTKEYQDSVFEREDLHPTNINNIIAIPHPMVMSASSSKISVAIVPNGIYWNETEKVKFVFLFAINKDEYEKTNFIYDILLELMEDKQIQKDILEKPNILTLMKYVKELYKK